MRFVTDKPGDDPLVWRFLSDRTDLPWSTDLHVIGLQRRDLSIACAVGYNAWVLDSVSMHVAFDSPHSLTRQFLREAFMYPFVGCGKQTVYGMTPITFEPVTRFNKRIGFREIHRTRHFILHEMNREECRWIRGPNGQKFSTTRT